MTTTETPRRTPWGVVAVLCVSSFAVMMDTTIVNVAMPSLVVDLRAGLDQVLWINNSYLLVFGALLIIMSRFGDIFGTRRLLVWGLVLFGVSSVLCGFVQNPGELIAARALLGLGAAMMSPQPLVIISATIAPQGRGAAMGVFTSMVGFAAVLGPTIGGLLVSYVGWRSIFFVNVPIVIVSVWLSLKVLPALRIGRRHRMDWTGVVLATLGLLGIVFGVIEGARYNWGQIVGIINIPDVIAVGVLLVIAFFYWEWRQRDAEPVVPLSLFRDKALTALVLLQAVVSFAMFGQMLLMSFNFQSVLGMSAVVAGLTGLPMTVTLSGLAPFAGRWADKIGGRVVVTIGFVVYAIGMLALSAVLSAHANSFTFILPLMVIGAGLGSLFAPLTTESLRRSPPQLAGALSGVLNTARQLGSVIGAAAIGALLASKLASGMRNLAAANAGQLPGEVRSGFLGAFSHVSGSQLQIGRGESGGPQVPSGLPAELAARVGQLIHSVFVDAYLDSMRFTLYVLAGLLVVSAVIAVAFVRRSAGAPAAAGMPAAVATSAGPVGPAEPTVSAGDARSTDQAWAGSTTADDES